MEAIAALGEAGAADKSAISNFIGSKNSDLPPDHPSLLSTHLDRMKENGELLHVDGYYTKPGTNAPAKRGRGRPPKPKSELSSGADLPSPRSRGRPPKTKDPLAAAARRFLAGLVGLAIEQLSVSSLASLPSACRIVSSGVDVRTSKICELGILNYKAKRVLYPSEKSTRFPCHYDYYWSAIFEVEYKEYFTSQIFHAVAEVPKEALPEKCRPGFEAAWLTKIKFKMFLPEKCYTSLANAERSKQMHLQVDYLIFTQRCWK